MRYAFLFILGMLIVGVAPAQPVIVVNAGSSHTTLSVFDVKAFQSGAMPSVHEIDTIEGDFAISSFADSPEQAVETFKPLFDKVHANMPEQTPVYILATGGMRLVPEAKQHAIYSALKQYLRNETNYQVKKIETISGQMEGVYGWLSVNYLSHRLDSDSLSTLGVLDMGGASAEITFDTNKAFNSDDIVSLTINGHDYTLYAHSFLGLGQNEARATVNNPACYPTGATMPDGQIGQFNNGQCRESVKRFVRANGVNASVPKDRKTDFIAISGYYFTMDFFNVLENPKGLNKAVNAVCSNNDWATLQAQYPKVKSKYLIANCFNGRYNQAMLDYGFHDLLVKNRVQAVNKINNTPIDWTLGAALYTALDKG